ncbi:MAG: terminase gpA endonuclease subunit [Candidatus Thiodiazotropha endolucinida]
MVISSADPYGLPSKLSRITQRVLKAMMTRAALEFVPPKLIPSVEWVEEYFYLPEEGADLPGLYSLDYAPYFYGIFAALDDPEIPEVVAMKAAQIGWTFGLVGYLGKRIDLEPGAIVMLFAADEAAREFVDEKFTPSVNASPRLANRVDVSTSRKSGNRSLFKKFPGGFLKLGGSGSIHKVKSTPAKLVIVEEPDDAKENVKEQGDAILLLWERVKRARQGKRVMGGTPSIAGLSRVEEHIEQSDKRVLPVVCHSCGDAHVLDFNNVVWSSADSGPDHPVYGSALPETAVYVCPHCGTPWDDYQRKENIRNTVRQAVADNDPYCGWTPTAPYNGVAGFMELSELYSCLPGAGVVDLVRDHLKAEYRAAQGDENAKIVFVNSKLGRPYEFKGEEADAETLRELALDYKELVVPAGGLLVTAGVDVQGGRLAIIIRAWGRGEESWGIYWGELPAEDTRLKSDPVWDALDALLFNGFELARGGRIRLSAVSIDSSDGNSSDAAYHWVRSRAKKHRDVLIMAVKGSSEQTDPEIFVTPKIRGVDHRNPKKQTKADKYGVKVYIVGTNKAKDWISPRLAKAGPGPEHMHIYADVRADYFDQVTAETKAPHRRIRNRKIWQLKSGRRNEALDCEVYALHSARARRIHLMRADQWDALEQSIMQVELFPKTESVSQETDEEAPQEKQGGRFKIKRRRNR